MYSFVKKHFIAFIYLTLLFASSQGSAQSAFKVDNAKGMMQEVFPVTLNMQCRTGECTGRYTFGTALSFDLFGIREETGEVKLFEKDSLGQNIAYLEGILNKDELELNWYDMDRILSYPMSFSPQKEASNSLYHLVQLRGGPESKIYDIMLFPATKEIAISNDKDRKLEILPYDCEDGDCTKVVVLCNKSLLFEEIGLYQMKSGYYRCKVLEKNQNKAVFTLQGVDTVKINHKLDSDYNLLVDLEYPSINRSGFDTWMETFVTEKVKEISDDISSATISVNYKKSRFGNEAYGWFHIDHLSNNMVSGTYTLTKSWEDDTSKFGFVFDLKSNQIIELQSIFEQEGIPEELVSLLKQKTKFMGFGPEHNKYIANAGFNAVSLSLNGLILHTAFNMIYGDSEVVIPYHEIKSMIKNKSIIKEFIK